MAGSPCCEGQAPSTEARWAPPRQPPPQGHRAAMGVMQKHGSPPLALRPAPVWSRLEAALRGLH
eukprot:13164248-Alexandrium_andersonii.AAC.1